ncbi:MAG: hypothetical protein LBI39_02615 [Puniceicoccales bacterium]|jgi:hypothetical protein|nr:hypothetical protein [Puniceicoccales bacterium]
MEMVIKKLSWQNYIYGLLRRKLSPGIGRFLRGHHLKWTLDVSAVDGVLEEFIEKNDLPDAIIGDDGVARVRLDALSELSVDFSCEEKTCVHILAAIGHGTVAHMLKGLWICDPTRLVGRPMHFVSVEDEGEWRVGFLIVLDGWKRIGVDALTAAMAQLSGAFARLGHS